MTMIKFRGKSVDSGEWVYGSYVKTVSSVDVFNLEGFVREEKGKEFHRIVDINGNFDDVRPETVGQFTGKEDCEGQDIWQSDILCEIYRGKQITPGVVEQKSMSMAIQGSVEDFYVTCWAFGDNYIVDESDSGCEYYKVIGNEHDNPELLGK